MRRDGFQDYYAVKSHLAAARRLVEGCGNTCAALFRAVDAALEGEIALKGEAARAGEAALGEDTLEREAAQAGENVRVGDEGGGTASDGGGGTCKARTRRRACLP